MKIDIRKITSEGLDIAASEPVSAYDIKIEGVEFIEPAAVDIFVNKVDEMLLVNGSVRTKVSLVCSRCLKKISQVLENREFSFERDITGLNEVDISENIREDIIVLVPVKPLCKKECKGICPQCGQDLNENKCSCRKKKTDLKWGVLDKLKLK